MAGAGEDEDADWLRELLAPSPQREDSKNRDGVSSLTTQRPQSFSQSCFQPEETFPFQGRHCRRRLWLHLPLSAQRTHRVQQQGLGSGTLTSQASGRTHAVS